MEATDNDWRSLGVLRLPYATLRRIATILDAPSLANWKTIFAMMPEYGLIEQQALASEDRCGRSPSMAMFQEMEARGKTVGDLYGYADSAHLKMVCDLIQEGLTASGIPVGVNKSPRPPPPPPSQSPGDSSSTGVNSEASATYELVSYSLLAEATSNFSASEWSEGGHHIGKGGFGDVYCCRLKLAGRDRQVAVKVLHEKSSVEKGKTFESELKILSELDHPALVPLLACSHDGPQLCLLYPFMSLRSLDLHLSSPLMTPYNRTSVALDISSGLHYLHTCCSSVLVHRDVKSANVLLEEGWKAKLADFGLVRSLSVEASTAVTGTVVGTMVYMAPEYLMGVVSPAADIYALGVILLELLFSCRACDGPPGADNDLISYLEECDDDPLQVCTSSWSKEDGERIMTLANHCTHENRKKRPNSGEVISKLTNIHQTLQSSTKC